MSETLTKNEAAGRYELWLDGKLASILEYREADAGEQSVTLLTHAETARDQRGNGLAARVTDFALDDLRAAGRKADPICGFVAEHMANHPDRFADLLVEQPHAAFCEIERVL